MNEETTMSELKVHTLILQEIRALLVEMVTPAREARATLANYFNGPQPFQMFAPRTLPDGGFNGGGIVTFTGQSETTEVESPRD